MKSRVIFLHSVFLSPSHPFFRDLFLAFRTATRPHAPLASSESIFSFLLRRSHTHIQRNDVVIKRYKKTFHRTEGRNKKKKNSNGIRTSRPQTLRRTRRRFHDGNRPRSVHSKLNPSRSLGRSIRTHEAGGIPSSEA